MNFWNWDPMDQAQAPPEAMQALMVNGLSATPSNPDIIPLLSIYTNTYYFFLEEEQY